jgi:hypothetical protein
MLWETLANASEDMASAIYFVAKGRTDMNFNRILYSNLNSRQKEAFNFQKVSAVLADYGFIRSASAAIGAARTSSRSTAVTSRPGTNLGSSQSERHRAFWRYGYRCHQSPATAHTMVQRK